MYEDGRTIVQFRITKIYTFSMLGEKKKQKKWIIHDSVSCVFFDLRPLGIGDKYEFRN